MSDILKNMYKAIPKPLLLNKSELCFYLSKNVYELNKKNIINGRFLGIEIVVDGMIKEECVYLMEKQ